jgi:hypothetical protein
MIDIKLVRNGNYFGYEILLKDADIRDTIQFDRIVPVMNAVIDRRIQEMKIRFQKNKIKKNIIKSKKLG